MLGSARLVARRAGSHPGVLLTATLTALVAATLLVSSTVHALRGVRCRLMPVSWWRWSAGRARARPPCSTSSVAWTGPTTATSWSTARSSTIWTSAASYGCGESGSASASSPSACCPSCPRGERRRAAAHAPPASQQQRVAIARALAPRPRLLLADEPTGQLDSGTGQQVIALLRDLVHGSQSAALVATHDPALVSFADRVLHLRDGRLEDTP